jgi:3D (Asp-Asp-Asp) domain-containing protein
MTKSLFSRSAAATAAFIVISLIFVANPSVAETPAPSPQDPKTPPYRASQGEDEITNADVPVVAGDALDAVNVEATAPATTADQTTAETQTFSATAYSLRGRTASGRPVSKGVIAADHRILPLGSQVRIAAGQYSGDYLVADTGPAIRGREIDIWVPNPREARRFGRRRVLLTVLHYARKRKPSTR